ncbi:MAG: hypothetical protein FRX49_04631 [Trebouxia sp. A1-2]|nr:MAG: hypothetical protein FRX49_04631 [Trebouxia sp. A1-2]
MQAFVMGITGAYHTDFPCLVNQEHPLLKKLDLTNTQLHGHALFFTGSAEWCGGVGWLTGAFSNAVEYVSAQPAPVVTQHSRHDMKFLNAC